MSMSRHEYFEELMSASLAGDVTEGEREELDAHLDTCAQCRATLAAFADQRRIMAGLRHVGAPRDLHARVRTGIERGASGGVPWWRRPAVMFGGLGGAAAAVAGAALAMVLLNGTPDDGQVGGASEAPLPAVSGAPAPTQPGTLPTTEPDPSQAPVSPAPPPSQAPVEVLPDPDVYLAYTGPFDNLGLTLRDGRTGQTIREVETPMGPPIAAEMSPDGQWLAYITQLGESGMNEVWALRVADAEPTDDPDAVPPLESPIEVGTSVRLGESIAGSPFLEQLFWSPNSYYLTYTLADPSGNTDVWIFQPDFGEPRALTNVGNAYAGSWAFGGAGTSFAWISTAGTEPISYLHAFQDSAGNPNAPLLSGTGDPAQSAVAVVEGFQPMMNADGSRAILWLGGMQETPEGWLFVEAGAPYITEVRALEGRFELVNALPLFSDVSIGRDAFATAGITWGADGDAYAVWGAEWTGIPQGRGGEYPNINRVYFSHASDDREITEFHAIDEADIPQGASVVDVKVPMGDYLLITARFPGGGVMEAPTADLIFVTRNTGNVPDEVAVFEGPGDGGWFGPAAYDASWEPVTP